jgi:hypothetical protein
LVDGERPRAFGPDRPIRTVRRLCRGEDCVAANPGRKQDSGDGYDPLAHDRSSGSDLASSDATVPGQERAPMQSRADGTETRAWRKPHPGKRFLCWQAAVQRWKELPTGLLAAL